MPNFFTPEHEAFRKSVRSWVDRELTPLEVTLTGGFKLPTDEAVSFEHYLMRHDAAYQAVLRPVEGTMCCPL